MKLEEAKNMNNIFKLNLNKISEGRFKSEEEKNKFENNKLLYKSQEAVIKLFNDYSSIVSEAKYKSMYGEGFKILTPKQILQRLPIALAQVKAGNTSENLLNEVRKIICSLCRGKEITKKLYKNIMNSIKL